MGWVRPGPLGAPGRLTSVTCRLLAQHLAKLGPQIRVSHKVGAGREIPWEISQLALGAASGFCCLEASGRK